MFKRVNFEDWTLIVPVISFIVTLLVFVSFFIKTVLMDKKTVERSANLALGNDTENSTEKQYEQ